MAEDVKAHITGVVFQITSKAGRLGGRGRPRDRAGVHEDGDPGGGAAGGQGEGDQGGRGADRPGRRHRRRPGLRRRTDERRADPGASTTITAGRNRRLFDVAAALGEEAARTRRRQAVQLPDAQGDVRPHLRRRPDLARALEGRVADHALRRRRLRQPWPISGRAGTRSRREQRAFVDGARRRRTSSATLDYKNTEGKPFSAAARACSSSTWSTTPPTTAARSRPC